MPWMPLFEMLIYILIAINFIVFAAFGLDKSLAENGQWRISEATLLGWAFIGGTPGAYAGRALFRHKTRKQPFCRILHTIAVLQMMFVIFLIVYTVLPNAGAVQ